MKILIVSQYFYPENFRINDLAAELASRGHDVTVLTGIPNYPAGTFFPGYNWRGPWREKWKGVEIVRAPLIVRGKGGGIRLALNYLSFAFFASIVGNKLARDFDIIFVYEISPITVGIPAIAMKRRTKAPILFWVLDLWPKSVAAAGGVRSPLLLRALDRLTRWIYARCDKVLVQSCAFIEAVERMGVNRERILYFPGWAEAIYCPVQVAEPPVVLPSGFRVLFAGNIGAAQDFPAILEAAERLKTRRDIHWLIVGDGRMAEQVQADVTRRGLGATVHLLGRFPVESMPAFYANADALLVTLKRDPIFSLTIPGKVQPYLASGRPILGMLDGEGARVIAEAGAGLSCAAGDGLGLAERVLEMSRMTAEARAQMCARGRAYYLGHLEREMLFARLEAWMHAHCARAN